MGHEAVDAAIYGDLAKTREEAVHLGRMLQRELRLFHCVSGDRLFVDGFVFYRFRDGAPLGQEIFSIDRSAVSQGNNNRPRHVGEFGEMPLATLSEQVQHFKEIVPVSDRTHHFRKFSNVFVGCEAIDAMVFYGMAPTRVEAVQLGRVLAREAGLFKHASNESPYAFCDEFLLYQYTGNNTCISIDGDIMEQQSMSTGSLKLERAGFHHQIVKPRGELGLKAELFRSCVDVRDRTYRMVKYKSCFIGSEAVDATSMLFVGLAENQDQTVELGRKLATQLRLLHACSVGTRTSFDDAFVFYRFDERFEEKGLHNSFNDFSHDPSIDNTVVSRAQLAQMAEKFRACAVVKDRKHRFRMYRQCFMRNETVNALIDSGVVATQEQAVEFGRTLLREVNLF